MILLVDIQSFYASVEKAERPDLRHQPVVISGDPQRRHGVILAACPLAKSYGIQNAESLWEAKQKCPYVVVIRPRMKHYLQISLQLTELLEQYSDQVEPYSIDEQFIDVKGSESLFGSPLTIAQQIQHQIKRQFQLTARVGMGPNKVLSKMACDHFAKKKPQGIFRLDESNLRTALWPLPIDCLFGVGKRMDRHLRRMGIRTIGELAQFPLSRLQKKWGVSGHILWMSANGIDLSPVDRNTFQTPQSIGHQMTLPRDYHQAEAIQVVLLELCEEVCRRARGQRLIGKTIHVGCRGGDFSMPSGFHRQARLPEATNATIPLFRQAWQLFQTFWDRQPIRSLTVQLSQLVSDKHVQLNLFADQNRQITLGYTMDAIKERFGPTAILRAVSLTSSGLAQDRAQKIGGHRQ